MDELPPTFGPSPGFRASDVVKRKSGPVMLRRLFALVLGSAVATAALAVPAHGQESSPYEIKGYPALTLYDEDEQALLFGRVWNDSDQPAQATLTLDGTVVDERVLAPGSRGTLEFIVDGRDLERSFTPGRFAIAGAYGQEEQRTAVIKGLSVDTNGAPTFTPCSTVTWFYDGSFEPRRASRMKRDVVRGLNRIQRQVGLRFREVDDPDQAQLTFRWQKFADRDVLAEGGWSRANSQYSGTVLLSSSSRGMADSAGTRSRTVTVQHEVFHVLGIGHSENPKSLMYYMQKAQLKQKLTALDRKVIDLLYSPATC